MLSPLDGVPALRVYPQVLADLLLALEHTWDIMGQWAPLPDTWEVLPLIWVDLPRTIWAALLPLIWAVRLALLWVNPSTEAQVDHQAPFLRGQDSLVPEGQAVFLLDPVYPPWALVCEDLPTLADLEGPQSTRIVSLLVRPLSLLCTNRHPSAP